MNGRHFLPLWFLLMSGVSFPYRTASAEMPAADSNFVAVPADSIASDLPVFVLPRQVISVSRRRETGLRAPGAVSVIDRRSIEETVTLTPVDLVRTVPGVDFASKGLNQHSFATRGDRSINSTALLMLMDYRQASVPSLGFNLPYLLTVDPEDIAQIEVVRGAGAALYGPDSDKGILHILTRSPFESAGTRISSTLGERSVRRFGFRHASVLDDHWSFRLSGSHHRGDNWPSVDSVEVQNRARALAGGADPDTLLVGLRDYASEQWAGDARVDWRSGNGASISLNGGVARAVNNLDFTAEAGGIQVRDWQYGYLQARSKHGRLFTNLYLNTSDAGETYILRTGDRVVDQSRMLGLQVQHGADVDHYRLLYGGDLRTTQPRTGGTINGRNEDHDTSTEVGAYIHSTSEISGAIDAVAALRGDYHDRLGDLAISPRLGMIYHPTESQTLRLVYNRAFNSPSSTELFIDLRQGSLAGLYDVRVSGIPASGFTFTPECDGGPCMWTPTPGGPIRYPVDATRAWPLLVNYLISQGGPEELANIPAPSGDDVGSVIAVLDPTSGTATPVSPGAIADVEPLKRTLTHSIELGYKAELAERASVSVEMYYWQRRNPVGENYIATPSVFMNQEDLAAYLATEGLDPVLADSLAGVMAGLPTGTISPDQAGASADLLVLAKQGGHYDNLGADLDLELALTGTIWTQLTYSWILDNTYSDVDVLGRVVLGVPKNKGSVSVGYRDSRGRWSASLRARVQESFPVVNGIYRGYVDAFGTFDLALNYRIPVSREMRLSVTATNVFDNRHREFVGTPDLGRLVVGRLAIQF